MSGPFDLIRRRSVRFQLTSLMDLLLIIVFAQYLEFHRSQDQTQSQVEQEILQARQLAQRELSRRVTELDQLRSELIQDNRRLRQQKDEAELLAADATRRETLAEELLDRVLQLQSVAVDMPQPDESEQTRRAAEAKARQLQGAGAAELLRFLAGYDELLKRAEIWTLHVSNRGDIEMSAGDDGAASMSFRLESKSQQARTDEFVSQIRTVYSQLPQPKGLVVILVSYSPRAVAGNYQPLLDGMPEVIEWLRKDSGGRTRFEYSVIGAVDDPVRDLSLELSPQ